VAALIARIAELEKFGMEKAEENAKQQAALDKLTRRFDTLKMFQLKAASDANHVNLQRQINDQGHWLRQQQHQTPSPQVPAWNGTPRPASVLPPGPTPALAPAPAGCHYGQYLPQHHQGGFR
jgi:hypothetical protein